MSNRELNLIFGLVSKLYMMAAAVAWITGGTGMYVAGILGTLSLISHIIAWKFES